MAALALVILTAVIGAAEPVVTCVERKGASYKEPQTLAALRRCHQERIAAARSTAKTEPTGDVLDRWDDLQRAEVADYLSRNPDRATMSEEKWRPEPRETAYSRQKDSDLPDQEAVSRAVKDAEARKEDGGDIEKSLWEKTDGGKKGITPDVAKELIKHIRAQKEQPVGPETLDLLDSLYTDGPNLSDSTVEKLRGAARKAKASGMSLGVDSETEYELLRDGAPRRAGTR